jgi:hypothetical protein
MILRTLYLRSIARRHIGRIILAGMNDGRSGVLGPVVAAGWLGLELRRESGDTIHMPWSRIVHITTGPGIERQFHEACAEDADDADRPAFRPALSVDEIAAILAQEAA